MSLGLCVAVMTGCGSSESSTPQSQAPSTPEAPAEQKSAGSWDMQRLLLGTSSQGGTYYVWGGGWAKIMNESVPNTDISVEVTGGPNTNIQLIQDGQMELGFATTWLAGEAYNGVGWADKKYDKIRGLFPMYSSVLHAYSLKDGPIETIHDFTTKHVSVGAPGSTSDKAGREVLDILGIEPSKISGLPTNTAVGNLRDGTVDAGFAVTGVPGPFMMDLETTHEVNHIGLTDEELQKITEKFPYWSAGVIPKGTYKHQTEDTKVVEFWNYAIGSSELPEDFVYELVKRTFEKQQDLLAVDPSAKQTVVENVTKSSIPLHPGAVRYYKEQGIEIPDNLLPPEMK